MVEKVLVCLLAGLGAGLGTGFAGMSAAAVISPMLITFLGMEPYEAVGIALASDVLASAASAWTYGKNKNLDIRNGLLMMAAVLAFTALTGAVSHFTIGGLPDGWTLALCMAFTLLFAQIAAKIANKSKPETLNRVVGVVLVVLGVVILAVQYLG